MITRSFDRSSARGHGLALSTLALAATLAACSSAPADNPALERARERWHSAARQPELATLAQAERARAREALDRAERAHADGDAPATVDHLAYMAGQRVVVAQETARSRAAQAVTAGAAAERDSLRLAQRTQQVERAERQLDSAAQLNARQGAQLASAERATVRTAGELASAERDIARQRAELAQSEASVRAAQAQVSDRDARVSDLEGQLRDLDARRTERGIVVTLGDLLFGSGQDRLQDDGLRSVDRLAEFFRRNPSRRAVIEGFTDSQGSDVSNRDLSDRRARAVMNALVLQGVSAARLSTRAHGEGSPVADNARADGRRMNRRVEVVFAAEAGDLLQR